MSLARVWGRQIYGAALAAVLIPVAIIGALLVLTGGSLSRISDLGQVFTGPGIPGAGGSSAKAAGVVRTAVPATDIAQLASTSLPGPTASASGSVTRPRPTVSTTPLSTAPTTVINGGSAPVPARRPAPGSAPRSGAPVRAPRRR